MRSKSRLRENARDLGLILGAILVGAVVYTVAQNAFSSFFAMVVLVAIARPAGRFLCSLARSTDTRGAVQKNLLSENTSPRT